MLAVTLELGGPSLFEHAACGALPVEVNVLGHVGQDRGDGDGEAVQHLADDGLRAATSEVVNVRDVEPVLGHVEVKVGEVGGGETEEGLDHDAVVVAGVGIVDVLKEFT